MDSSGLPLTAIHEDDDACDAFEAAWRGAALDNAPRPRIEDFLGSTEGDRRLSRLRQLIELEVALRDREGESPSAGEYLSRFPGESRAVLSAFRIVEDAGPTEANGPVDLAVGTPSSPATPGANGARLPSTQPMPGAGPSQSPPLPERFGRYEVREFLGRGGFGLVYLAWDTVIKRQVALKVPRPGASGRYDEALLTDAQGAGPLNHPGIVRIYDIFHPDEETFVVAMEYVEGKDLERLLRQERLTHARAVALVKRVAEAVQRAHDIGLVHRDLKPANILIDAKTGEPKVTDFGLSVGAGSPTRRTDNAGTPPYMAPEQVRRESHRINNKTDLWALGVILYRALTGVLPFPGRSHADIFDSILHREPTPPRRLDPSLPRELERITLRCLSKRMDDRHATAAELAEDLGLWQADRLLKRVDSASGESGQSFGGIVGATSIASKGLRSYDGTDAGFFLAMIPGPKGRALPESLRFWKDRIESRDLASGSPGAGAFSVGLLYGPSGGGKSSFVRAGLLPRLDPRVRSVYLEASPSSTEDRLLVKLREKAPGIPQVNDLAGAVAAIRAGEAGLEPGDKALIVLDQFEQWLQAHPGAGLSSPLVRALRQCDGVKAQAILLVRDDFWLPVSRFFRALEVPLIEGENSASVELMDAPHARKVLLEFGRACGRLPESGQPGPAASRFLDEAVEGLRGPDGRIVPVRLSLFNEVARRHDWAPATLKALGGVEGIGVTFLEQTFSATPYRDRRRPAQAVLKALLPPPGSVLRGKARSASELCEAAGLARPEDCDDLLRMLDSELRLVTAAGPNGPGADARGDGDAEGAGDAGQATAAAPGEAYYQLAHDSLVSWVRKWVEREEGATRAGRAKSRLTTIAAVWRDSPGPRRLPSLAEWVDILWHARSRPWSPDERLMMRAATRHHVVRCAAAAAVTVALAVGGHQWRRQSAARATVAEALDLEPSALKARLPSLSEGRASLLPPLRLAAATPGLSAPRKRNALALLQQFEPTPGRAAALARLVPSADVDDLAMIRESLANGPRVAVAPTLWVDAGGTDAGPSRRLNAAVVLAGIDPDSSEWRRAAPAVAKALAAVEPFWIGRWYSLLAPASPALLPAVAEELASPSISPQAFHRLCLAVLAENHGPAAGAALQEIANRIDREALPSLVEGGSAEERASRRAAEAAADDRALRRASVAAALAEIGAVGQSWRLLDSNGDDLRLRAVLIDRLGRFAVNPRGLLDHLSDAGVSPSELQGTALALAEIVDLRPDRLSPGLLSEVADRAVLLERSHPDPGVHSAASLLRRRARPDGPALEAEAPAVAPTGGKRWYVGHNGHAFAVVDLGAGWVGARPHERGFNDREARSYFQVGRTVAVSFTEVTVRQFRESGIEVDHHEETGPSPDHPINNVNWFQSVLYCNWLSKRAGLRPCYIEGPDGSITVDPEAIDAGGYRLPTEAEWELLCRAGTNTARPFGDSDALIARYACGWTNSDDQTMRVGLLLPNGHGIFDALGNLWEWCHSGGTAETKPGGDLDVPGRPAGTPEAPARDRVDSETVKPRTGLAEDSTTASYRVLKGSAYDYASSHARSGRWTYSEPSYSRNYDGFRVARTIARP